MNNNKPDLQLVKVVDRGLNAQCEQLDTETLRRLRQARLVAVQTPPARWAGMRRAIFAPTILHVPLGQLAVVVMAALVTGSLLLLPGEGLHWRGDDAVVGAEPALTGPVQHPDTMMDESSLTEMDVLMSNEDMEFLENLDIYEWLVAEYG
ncbi:MAG: hypothetical protein R3E95_12455 [Thiolinea sp.]